MSISDSQSVSIDQEIRSVMSKMFTGLSAKTLVLSAISGLEQDAHLILFEVWQ